MKVSLLIDDIRHERHKIPDLSWGFVPTMGYLHEGHLSLVRKALAENDRVVVSIYVNPTQFAPEEDLDSYPRDLQRDLALLEAEGVDLVFTPTDRTMYPAGFQTYVTVSEVSQPLEGASRPTHFRGVTTVVAKLFNIIQPHRAYFGQKDAQQTVVLQKMVDDLNFDIEMVICPIAREEDGLAMSSRNKYLSAAQRKAAPILQRALIEAKSAFLAGQRDGDELRKLMRDVISEEPLAAIDYVSVSNPWTLQELGVVGEAVLFSAAVFFGKTRLIDNILIT